MSVDFVHLHNHTDYSFLDGATKTKNLAQSALDLGMPAVAITDHGNLCGAVDFYTHARKIGVKPIIGCELYLTDASRFDKGPDIHGRPRPTYHLLLLAKNQVGWKNLIKLSSAGYLEGFYRKPRIDYDLLEQHREGLICLSGCLQGHISQTILRHGSEAGLEILGRYKDLFGDDFYIELQRHGIREEDIVSRELLTLANRTNTKLVVTNDTHYEKKEHAKSHDILLCVQTKADRDDPNRYRFSGTEFYMKSYEEMASLFPDYPDALKNTVEIAEKTEISFNFKEKHFPHFPLPKQIGDKSHDDYLKELCEAGMPKRYPELTDPVRERLDYELGIIKRMQLSSYFLIVRDFIQHARDNDIPVGPGRGSAAGCIVSYLIGITNIDPMRYDLLFERFINPERESYPDIDVDFSDQRRGEVIEYVRQKYGAGSVTQIMTYGRMLSKGAIRDVGRVIGIPLNEVDAIAKLVPDTAKTLVEAMEVSKELKAKVESKPDYRELMEMAMVLEGTIRNAGIHAAGVVITPDELTEHVPLYKAPDGETTTQFDMKYVEKLGLLKVDFLGLKTLTILERALKLIARRGINLELDSIPIDDKKTYELFARGETIGIFQFESGKMRENLRKLGPERLEDLIAMNALYRPGPMDNIDDFCKRKHGKQKITYIHPKMSSILDETYGIIVYQEQVMLIAHELAGMSLGRADVLRKAMGKKIKALMEELKPEFVAGCEKNGITKKQATEIWDLIEKFAKYGFNKSHAAGYSLVAYQTGYLKTHYPAEFMAASMSSRADNTDELVLFLEECKRMGIEVLPPDVNESEEEFIVTPEGNVRFGLCAVKNVGSAAIQAIEGERRVRSGFEDLFDLAETAVTSPLINRKVLETLIYSGAADSLQGHRAQQLAVLDNALLYAQQLKQEKANGQVSFFGNGEESIEIPRPELPEMPEMPAHERLTHERELLGFYFSGHPLLRYKLEVDAFSSRSISELDEVRNEGLVRIVGILENVDRRATRSKQMMARARLEDLTGAISLLIFPKTYEKINGKLQEHQAVLLTGRLQKKEDNTLEIIVDDVEPIEDAAARLTKRIVFHVNSDFQGEKVLGLENCIRNNPGSTPVRIIFHGENGQQFVTTSSRYKIRPTHDLLEMTESELGKDTVILETS